MADFSLSSPSFNATEVTVTPVSSAAKALTAARLGAGVVSFNLPKSGLQGFADTVAAEGLSVL